MRGRRKTNRDDNTVGETDTVDFKGLCNEFRTLFFHHETTDSHAQTNKEEKKKMMEKRE